MHKHAYIIRTPLSSRMPPLPTRISARSMRRWMPGSLKTPSTAKAAQPFLPDAQTTRNHQTDTIRTHIMTQDLDVITAPIHPLETDVAHALCRLYDRAQAGLIAMIEFGARVAQVQAALTEQAGPKRGPGRQQRQASRAGWPSTARGSYTNALALSRPGAVGGSAHGAGCSGHGGDYGGGRTRRSMMRWWRWWRVRAPAS